MAPQLKFDLTIPRFHDHGMADPYRRTYEYCQWVETQGYHAGFVGHHSFTPETRDPSAPFLFLSAVAARTTTLRLGTGIFIAPLHHPVSVTEQLCTLDQISNGRAIFGVGVGYRQYEFDGWGVPLDERGPRTDEIIQVVKQACSTGRYGHQGKIFTVPDNIVYPMPVQTPNPPIYVGGTSKGALRRAAQFGDCWFSLPMETIGHVKALADEYRAQCARFGTTPRITLMREAWCSETMEEAEQEWLPRALAFHRYYWETGTKGDEHDPVLQRVGNGEDVGMEEFARDRAFAGPPSFIKEEIERWHEAIGFDEICLIFATGKESTSDEKLRRSVGLFAQEVMPAFS